MSKLRLNVFNVLTLLNKQTCICVSQIVESYSFKLRISQTFHKISIDHVVVVDGLPCLIRENKVQLSNRALQSPAFKRGYG